MRNINVSIPTMLLLILVSVITTTAKASFPVARWGMDDNVSNATAIDSSGSNHGTFNDPTNPNTSFHHSTNYQEGSGSLLFDGDDYIQVYGYKGIAGMASRTCTAWIKSYGSHQGAIICWGTSATEQKWIFRVESTGALGVGIYGGWIKTVATPLHDGAWHHVAVTFSNDGSPNVADAKLYIDGVQKSTSNSPVAVNTGSVQDVMIGAHREDINGGGTPNMYFMGLLDDVRIYDYALSSTEINLLYELSPTPGDINVSVDSDLRWLARTGALSYDVYLGTTQSIVANAGQLLGDINRDGSADILDLSILASQWLTNGSADIVDNGIVDMDDFTALAATWGMDTPFKGNQISTTYDPGTLGGNATYYWRIDTIYPFGTTVGTVQSFMTVAAAPGTASDPSPANNATGVSVTTDLSWTAGSGATSHDVYFGTTSPSTFQGNQTNTTFDPGTLAGDTIYYWRIDELNAGGVTTGTVWSFTTIPAQPAQASNPSPSNESAKLWIDTDISWTAGPGATSHDVYFGTDPTPDAGEFKVNQSGTTYNPGTLANNTTYYWRIDGVNSVGTTTGTVWSFTTSSPRLTPEEFPIQAWDAPWRPVGPFYDVETCRTMYECGFNLAGFVDPDELDNVGAAGLKAHVWDWKFVAMANNGNVLWWDKSVKDSTAAWIVDLVGDHPALFGYFIADEPGVETFTGVGDWVDSFHNADPDKQTFINLGWDYDWDSYVSIVQNDFLSYDYYGMLSDGTVHTVFYAALEKVYFASHNYSLPFQNVVSSMKLDYTAYPTPANLRLQAFASLAYGAHGITWFTYFVNSTTSEWLAPVDENGNKRDIWYMLQDVNLYLHRIGPVYTTLNNVNVFHYPNVPSGTTWMPYPSKGISSSYFVNSLSGGDFCVGEFYDPSGHPYIMLVNKSLTNTSNFNVTFKQAGTIYRVNSDTGQFETLESNERYLAPGEGMLISVQ